ncbi:MAG: ligase-associated DNA damage response endonuclease PdeM [Myxococcota bacterium]
MEFSRTTSDQNQRQAELEIRGHRFHLLPERAVWWPSESALFVADLHWGKDETFRQRGVPLPAGQLGHELARLRRVLERTGAEKLYVLGDLIHGRQGITPGVRDRIATWRTSIYVEMILVRGNHDRHLPQLPESWHIDSHLEPLRVGEFALAHHPEPVTDGFAWAGHLHPTVELESRSDKLRLPCFHIRKNVGVLPAFTAFSAGPRVKRQPADRIFTIAEEHVVEV